MGFFSLCARHVSKYANIVNADQYGTDSVSGGVSDSGLGIVGAVERNPVVCVDLLVVVIVRVVEVLPYVTLGVHVVLVQVVVHVDVSETIADLWRVVIRNGREGLEQIGINLLGLGHSIPLLFLGLGVALLHVGLDDVEVEREDTGVNEEVGAPAHSSEGAQSVGSETHPFFINNYIIADIIILKFLCHHMK